MLPVICAAIVILGTSFKLLHHSSLDGLVAVPYTPSRATESLQRLLTSSMWQEEVLDTLSIQTEQALAVDWLTVINHTLATNEANWLLLEKESYLWTHVFQLILDLVRNQVSVNKDSLRELIETFWLIKKEVDTYRPIPEETWKRHLTIGDTEDPRDNGFQETPVWQDPKAQALLFQIAAIAARAPHKISIGQQYSIKQRLIKKIMSVVNDGDYDESDDETHLAVANAIFIHEVLNPLRSESVALGRWQGFDPLPRQGLLRQAWGGIRWMIQEEVDTALPIVSKDTDPSIAFMATYDRSELALANTRIVMSSELKHLLDEPLTKHIFIPFCNHAHWQAAYIEKEGKRLTIHLFDPYGRQSAKRSLKPEMNYLIDKALGNDKQAYRINMIEVNVPYPQHGANACGYYVVSFAHYLMKSLGLTPAQTDTDAGYNKTIAESFTKSQKAIEQSVIALHDSRFSSDDPSHVFGSSSIFSFFNHASSSSMIPQKAQLITQPLQTSLGKALGLKIIKSVKSDPLLDRADIKVVREEIVSLTKKGSHYFNFGANEKAARLRTAYKDYLSRLEEGNVVTKCMTDDKAVSGAVDAYRHFGFFYRALEACTGYKKLTRTRLAIDKRLAPK